MTRRCANGWRIIMHVIDLNAGAPVYADLPDPLNLKENDVFELNYPEIFGECRTASFQVLENTPGHLKLGMACEFDLPEGYDYGRNEVCTIIPAAAAPGETRITAELENRLRRLHLQVLKVDQEDRSTPLNGAWFTVRDIENAAGGSLEQKRSEDAARIRLEDIPPDAEAGDLVPVLRAGRNSPMIRYRIEQVEDSQIVIAEFTGNRPGRRHYVPRKGFSRTSPVLYCDIVRAAGKLKSGELFEVRRKQDSSLVKMYRILALEKAPGMICCGCAVFISLLFCSLYRYPDFAIIIIRIFGQRSVHFNVVVAGQLVVCHRRQPLTPDFCVHILQRLRQCAVTREYRPCVRWRRPCRIRRIRSRRLMS